MIRMQLGWAWAEGVGACVLSKQDDVINHCAMIKFAPNLGGSNNAMQKEMMYDKTQTQIFSAMWCPKIVQYWGGGILTPRDRTYPANNKPLEIPSQWLENDRLLFGASVLKVAKYNRVCMVFLKLATS